ncbi:MAG: hypothetical protein JW697_08960, partial [Kosmotogaceae bacterium]|nr:hypothetical protein [Kosmotogaceae bacterium]
PSLSSFSTGISRTNREFWSCTIRRERADMGQSPSVASRATRGQSLPSAAASSDFVGQKSRCVHVKIGILTRSFVRMTGYYAKTGTGRFLRSSIRPKDRNPCQKHVRRT